MRLRRFGQPESIPPRQELRHVINDIHGFRNTVFHLTDSELLRKSNIVRLILTHPDRDHDPDLIDFITRTDVGMVLAEGKTEAFLLSRLIQTGMAQVPVDVTSLFSIFMSPDAARSMVGDLQERYPRILAERGRCRSWLWYSGQVGICLCPVVWAAIRRVSGWERLTEWWRRAE